MSPVRILHIVTYMSRGGLETMIMNYYRKIDRNKVQFDFLVHRDFEGDYEKEILNLGGRIYRVSKLIPWSGLYKKELKEFFIEHPEYKIVHVHQDCLSSVALKVAKECGIPVRIAHAHNTSQNKDLKYPIKLFYMKKIPKYATDFFACSVSAGEWMFGGNEFLIMNNAIDSSMFKYNHETAKRVYEEFNIEDKLVVGNVANFSQAKNHSFMIDIFSELVKLKSDSVLLLVGSGHLQESIKEKAMSCGVSDRVIFAGKRSDVNELLQSMDVFIFPSLFEGLPVTMIEAQAAGLPCIISANVPEECIKTEGLVSIKSLSDSPADWAKEVVLRSREGHSDHINEIIENGFDIIEASKWLQDFYLEKLNEK